MNLQVIGRIVSILIGAAVLFGLERGFDLQIYIALPVAIVAYTASRFAFAIFGATTDPNVK